MAITIKGLRPIENGSIPFAGGELCALEITSVTGDDPSDGDGQILTYKNGELHHNYILSWTKDGVGHAFGTEISFSEVFGLRAKRAEAIATYITDQLHHEIAMIATKPGEFDHPHVVSFTNVADAYRDAFGEDSEEFKNVWSPEIETLVDNHVYIRNVLAKVAQMIEKGFNETYHLGVAESIVHLIRTSKHINSDGKVSGPTMASVEDLFRIVREKLTLEMSNEIPPFLLMDENIPEILKK